MRRADPISVRVRAPSRGLVTRFPRESADMYRQGDMQRTATDAQNVRYEDGVIRNAPGYTQAQVGSMVASLVAHWRMDEADGTRFDASINSYDLSYDQHQIPLIQVTGKIGKAAQTPVLTHPVFITTSQLFNNIDEPLIQLANASFTISGWFNIASSSLTTALFSFPGAALTVSSGAFVANLFKSNPTTGFISHTFSSSVPVGSWFFLVMTYDSTASGGTITIKVNDVADGSPLTGTLLGAAGPQIVTVFGHSPPFGGTQQLAVDSLSAWQRVLGSGELTSLYNSGNGLDFPFNNGAYTLLYQGNLIGSVPTPLIAAHGGLVDSLDRSFTSGVFYLTPTNLFSGSAPTTGYPWTATDFFDTIILAQHDNPAQYWTAPTPNVCQPLPGLPSTDSQWDGVEAFFGHVLLWKDDRLKWSDKDDFTNWIPVATTAASAVFTIDTPGFTQPATGATVAIPVTTDPVAAGIVVGQFIFVQDNRGSGTANQFYDYYQVTAVATGPNVITARLQDLTGHTTTGLTVASGQSLFTVDANEAGETRVVGSKMNGRIFKIIAMGDYAYIFKERSVQSIQYVGLQSGTFFIHPELSDEGALSRTAVLNLGDGRIVFLGHKELYLYTGGPSPQPIATQVTRQVLKEIDRTRLQEIVMAHKEIRHEVWISYPISGGQKTLIWNYVEDTCSFDYYDSSVGGITAASDVDFSVDPPWNSLPDSLTWDTIDPTLDWLSFAGASTDRILLLGFGDGEIVVWGFGNTFNRNGRGYTCLSETQDFDLGEPDIWKYVDVVVIGLEISSSTNQPRTLYLQVGQRAGLGTPENSIVFTDPFPVSVSGNTSDVVKINPGGAGRYLRLRMFSQDPDVEWAVSSFEIHCRPGNTY
jgi:hypothetical protein